MRMAKGVAIAGGMGLALAISLVAGVSPVSAQSRPVDVRISTPSATDISAQARRERRPATRLRIERYQRLPPTAVRTCDAWYAQERRASGTTIVPKMSCRWVNG